MKSRALWVMVGLVLLAADLDARPGGGSSFRSSGGGSRSSSSSSFRSSSRSSSSSSFGSSRSSRSSAVYVSRPAVPPCAHPPEGARPAGAGWVLSDGTAVAEGTYCTPARLAAEAEEERTLGSIVAFIFAAVLAMVARGLRDNELVAVGLVPEVFAIGLAAVPIMLGKSPFAVAVWWGVMLFLLRAQKRRSRPPPNVGSTHVRITGAASAQGPATELAALKAADEGFSRVVFLDFATALYHALHTWPGTAREASLGVFFAPGVLERVRARQGNARFDQVVVGSVRLLSVSLRAGRQRIGVEFESNVTRHAPGQPARREVLLERWTFARDAGVRSPSPDKLRVLTCPACGAPVSVTDAGPCAHCGAVVQAGRMAWAVDEVVVAAQERFDTTGLGETVPEQGTDLPTLVDPDRDRSAQAIAGGDAQAFFASLGEQVVKPTFERMYAAWSSRRWAEARHLLGDRLWESQAFWVRQYEDKGLTNRLEQLEVRRIEPVRAEQDRDVEAVTVRVFARGLDYTVDASGRTIGGDPRRPRAFSEYWVFVRARGAKERPEHAAPKCPNCGAPLDKLGAAGVCGYCDAKVTTGDHGWVLTQIIQDEVYAR